MGGQDLRCKVSNGGDPQQPHRLLACGLRIDLCPFELRQAPRRLFEKSPSHFGKLKAASRSASESRRRCDSSSEILFETVDFGTRIAIPVLEKLPSCTTRTNIETLFKSIWHCPQTETMNSHYSI